MPIVYANVNDGYVSSQNANSDTARNAVTGTSVSSSISSASDSVVANRQSGRGGGYTYTFIRAFLYFDFRTVVSVPESATLNIYGYVNGGADIFVVKAESGIGTLSFSDFDAIDGWTNSGDQESNITKYSDEITSWSASGYNVIPLNAVALKDIVGSTLYVCLIESVHDLRNVTPTGSFKNGMYFQNSSGTSKDPYVDYKIGTPSTFFGAIF